MRLMLKLFLVGLLAVTGTLSAELKVLAFAGSTRKDSCNKKLINNIAEVAKKMGAKVTVVDLKDFPMPFYDADLEAKGMPEQAKRLRKMMLESDAIIISTPEYNGSVSGVLKNAIDWTSRNEEGKPSRDAYKGKKFVIFSCSPGSGGAEKASRHLGDIITNIGGDVGPLRLSFPHSENIFNAEGKFKEEATTNEDLKSELNFLFKPND